jgi:hypothetical protein
MIDVEELKPPEDRGPPEGKGLTAREKIIFFLELKKCSWPKEIQLETGLHSNTVYDTLAIMNKRGEIEKLDLKNLEEAPKVFKDRLPDLWAQNLKGRFIFKKMSFYVLAPDTKLEISEEKEEAILKGGSDFE